MTFNRIPTLLLLLLFTNSCKDQSHIERYGVRVDSIISLPDGFYAHRHGRLSYEDFKLEQYGVWANQDELGNVTDIFKANDFNNRLADTKTTIKKYNIDTTASKLLLQRFKDMSRKFKFGHVYIDRRTKISFSYRDGLSEQYVITLNDSLYEVYHKDPDFKLLANGWFEYIGD